MPLSPKLYTFLCGCFAALGSIFFGYDLGVISSVLPAPNFLEVTGHPDDNYQGFIVSALLLGAFVGCIPASLIADKFSRRTAIIVGAVVFLLGGALQTGAQNKGMMLAGRFFAGFSIGMLSLLAPLYQSEIAHPSIRGRLTTLQQFFLGIGAFIAGWIGYGCTEGALGTSLQWRLPLGLQMLPAVPLLFVSFLLPESPRWLMIVGREEEALLSLARLHAHGDTTDPLVLGEFEDMRLKVREEAAVETGWGGMLRDPQSLRKIMLGIILQFSVQMTGVSVLQYYSPRVFMAVGFSTGTTLLIQSLNNVVALIGEAAGVWYVDKIGRRPPLIIGNAVSGVTFVIGAALQQQYAVNKGSKSKGYAFVAMTYIFNFAFSSCIGPLSWAYPVEIMYTGIRAKGTALTSMSAWISNFMIGQVSPKAFTVIGWRYYIVFAVCGFTNALTMWAFYPETKGRTLEEMDEFFRETRLFVPGSHTKAISGRARERTLADGHGPITSEVQGNGFREKRDGDVKEGVYHSA